MAPHTTRSRVPRRVTRRGVPVVRAIPGAPVHRAAQGVEAPPLANSDDVPTTPSDDDPFLQSTHPKTEDSSADEERTDADNPAPLHIPEGSKPDPDDPTSGYVEKESDDQKPDYRIPGMEPPDAAPVPPSQVQTPELTHPPEAAPSAGDLTEGEPHKFPPDAAPVPGVDFPDKKGNPS